MLLAENGTIIAVSNGFRPTKASQYVRTLVQAVETTADANLGTGVETAARVSDALEAI